MKCRNSDDIMRISDNEQSSGKDEMIYIMGDSHGQFGGIETLGERFGTSCEKIIFGRNLRVQVKGHIEE